LGRSWERWDSSAWWRAGSGDFIRL